MRSASVRVFSVLCLLLGLASSLARGGVLDAIPPDSIGFVVIHNLTDASRSIDEVAKLVQAPAPGLLAQAKNMTGLVRGLNEQGDLAIVLTSIDPAPKHVILIPVANVADFFAALNMEEPADGIVEVQLIGLPTLVGRKGDYAALAPASDRDALEQFLAATTNLATDASLAAWLDTNKASVVVTSHGTKQLLPKLTNGIRAMQEQLRQVQGEQGQFAANAMNLYLDLFQAAESEVEQFGIGLRIDSAQTIDLVKRVQFTPGGACAQWAANAQPAARDVLAGLPAVPFVMAFGGVVSEAAMEHLMKFSEKMVQSQPMFNLSPEQAEKYAQLSAQTMSGVQSMSMLMGVAEPGTGIYGNTTAVMTFEDTQHFLDNYEKSLAELRELAQESKSPAIPVAATQRIMVGDTEALEVSMDLPDMKQLMPPGSPDPQKMMQFMVGADGKMKIYVAPADDHAVVMAYTSLERLKAALDFYRSKQPGLANDASIAKVAAALPPGSQFVVYVSLSGMAQVIQQTATSMVGIQPTAIPDFPESPPFGMAVKVSPSGAEGHLIVTGETLRTIGDVVAKFRGAASDPSPPPQ